MSVNTRRSVKIKSSAGSFEERPVLEVKFFSDNDIGKIINESLFPGSAKKRENVDVLPKSVTKRRRLNPKFNKTEKDEIESSEETDNNDLHEKPTSLYDENDVAGENICSFPTPKKKQGMIQKAVESASKNKAESGTPKGKRRMPTTPSTPVRSTTPSQKLPPRRQSGISNCIKLVKDTPKKSSATPKKIQDLANVAVSKTPYHLRVRRKRAMQDHRRELEDYENYSDSDYHGSEESSGTEECESSDQSSDEEADSDSGKGSSQALPVCRRSLHFSQPYAMSPYTKRTKDLNYVFTADEYFESRASKCKTSDHNLSRLKNPRLDGAAIHNLLSEHSVSTVHQDILAQLRADDIAMFHRWLFALSQGFSVLAYGLGSKYKILQSFQHEMLSDSHVLVVNGFFPSITVKEIVEIIATDLLGLKQVLPSTHVIIDWIKGRQSMPRVFLIVHNLDGEMLRCEKTQDILSRLASLPRVHLVASVDHINCPLLWDQAKLSAFNFMWEDVTSFLPYQEETSYETSLMVQNCGSLALSALLNVYRSLTHNSQGVFRVIMDKHIDENNQKYPGMAFSELYGRCREEMLVTSDLALRTMLTEFLDHQMIKWRRDGEHLYIPTDPAVLRQFHTLIQDS